MGEYILLAIGLIVLISYIRHLMLFPEDFGNYYYRSKYYKQTVELD